MNLSDNSINLFPLSLDGLNSIISDSLQILNQPVGVLQIDNNSDVYSSDDVKLNSIQTLNSGIITINSNVVSKDIFVENLIVSGNATFNQNISINNLIVSNNTLVNGNLIVSGNSTFGQNISISGLFVSNNTLLNNNLRVLGNSTFNQNLSSSFLFVSNNTLLNNNLRVSNNATFSQNISTSGLIVSNNTNLNNLLVNNNVTFSSNLSVNSLIVTGSSTFNSNITQRSNNCELVATGNVGLSINSNPSAGIVFLDFNSFTGVKNDYDSRIRSNAGISGQTSRGELILESGNLTLQALDSMDINGGNIRVFGNTTFNNNLSTSGLFVSNNTRINGNSTFNNNLSVSGLFVSNNTRLLNLQVTNTVTFNGDLFVGKNATFDSHVNISGLNVIHRAVMVSLQITQNGTLEVQGNSTFGSNISSNTLVVSSSARVSTLQITGTLSVGGNATFNTNVFLGTALCRNLIITASNVYTPGSIYSDANWGFLLRSRVNNPTVAVLAIADFNDNKLLYLNQTGNIGLGGVSNPTERLDIIGNSNFNNRLVNNTSSKINLIKSRNGLTTNNLDKLGSIEAYGTNTSNQVSRGAFIEFEQNNNATSTIAGRIKLNSRNELGVELEHIRIDNHVIIDNNQDANLFLSGRTDLGQNGLRFIYAPGSGTAYMDLKGADRLYFRADNTAGSTVRGSMFSDGRFQWGSNPLTMLADGQFAIGNISVAVNTAVSRNSANGILTIVSSDRRIKSNIKDLDDDYVKDFFKKVRPVMYDFHKHVENNKEHIGFIAQELEELLPPSQINTNSIHNKCELCKECSEECLHKDKCDCLILKDCKSFNNYAIISLNTKRIQLLVNEVETLKADLTKERIQYKVLRERQDKKILEQGLLLDKIVKSLANKSIFIK
jgi:cytoskeletal protein CcmA (bactofilin family)